MNYRHWHDILWTVIIYLYAIFIENIFSQSSVLKMLPYGLRAWLKWSERVPSKHRVLNSNPIPQKKLPFIFCIVKFCSKSVLSVYIRNLSLMHRDINEYTCRYCLLKVVQAYFSQKTRRTMEECHFIYFDMDD
jgi:hypothetical protein